jgi:hypothetical protein
MAYDPDHERAIRSEWEAHTLPDREICEKYGITPTRLSKLARDNGWVRRHPPTEAQIQRTVSLFSFDADEQLLMSASSVVAMHRKDVAKLRTISATLVDRLSLELSGQELPAGFICRGSRESPADLLEKLSRVLVRTTEIERQAFGLKTFNPEQAATDADLQRELDTLTRDVEEMARTKKEGALV